MAPATLDRTYLRPAAAATPRPTPARRRRTWRFSPAATLPALLLTAVLTSSPFAGPQTTRLAGRSARPAAHAAGHLPAGVGAAGWLLLALYLVLGAVGVAVLAYLTRRVRIADPAAAWPADPSDDRSAGTPAGTFWDAGAGR